MQNVSVQSGTIEPTKMVGANSCWRLVALAIRCDNQSPSGDGSYRCGLPARSQIPFGNAMGKKLCFREINR
ncbi:MAG: hypothetical protein E3K36_12500 [Candidatus Brocadia sp.]|nr:hypothetical protein [Candidatus Brocadia sp.]